MDPRPRWRTVRPRRLAPLRWLLGALALGCLWAGSAASAHATLVIGTLSFSPDPAAGAGELQATLVLEDPGLVEVEDAVVVLELRPIDDAADAPAINHQPDSDPVYVSDRLSETEPGTYQVAIPTPAPGTYVLSVRDRTYRQEEAVANLVVTFSPLTAVGEHPFVLPPTASGPASLGTWLVWLLGVPLLAGVLVTFLVLRGGRDAGDGGAGSGGASTADDGAAG